MHLRRKYQEKQLSECHTVVLNGTGNEEQRKEFHRFQMYSNTSWEIQARIN